MKAFLEGLVLVSVPSLTTKISVLQHRWPHTFQLPWPAKTHAELQQH